MKEERKAKVMLAKRSNPQKQGGITYKLNIPNSWINEMGISEEERDIVISFENGKMIIKKIDLK